MRDFLRPLVGTLSIACLATGLTILSTGGALAQAKPSPSGQMAPAQPAPPPLKQMALTDKQIDGVLAAQKDMDAITQKLPPNAAPSPKVIAQLDAVAKKNGFASYDAYNDVVDNITLVLSGFDPASKKYVGFEAATKAQIAQVQANKQMSAKDKKDALAELNDALKSPPPAIENKGNIDLVGKNYDKLADALGGGQQ
jgi:hypothetical protein